MRWSLWIAFAVLCVLSGTSWAIPREMSSELPPLEQQGILFGVIGLTALLFAARESVVSQDRLRECARLGGGGCGISLEFRWWLLNMRGAVCRR